MNNPVSTPEIYVLPGVFVLLVAAVGCPDIDAGDGSWVIRREKDIVIGCNHTAESWHLKCEQNEWVGKAGNCSIRTLYQLINYPSGFGGRTHH